MRRFATGLALLSPVWVAFAACGVQGNSAGGAGGALQCGVIPVQGPGYPCDPCANEKCCAELVDCVHAGESCATCAVYGTNHPDCAGVLPQAKALQDCTLKKCTEECWLGSLCNPALEHPVPQYDGGGCTPPEPDGGVTIAECAERGSTVVRGTLDGQPVELHSGMAALGFNQAYFPFSAGVQAPDMGDIGMTWGDICLLSGDTPVPVTGGSVQLLGDSARRDVEPCSLLWKPWNGPPSDKPLDYRFNLLVDGGQLTGCAMW